MSEKDGQKQLMVQYLLGELSAERRAEFEDAYLTDSQVFQELVALENEMMDKYILGELSPKERERFERSFLANPARRKTVETARSLLTYSAVAANAESLPELPSQQKQWYSSRLGQFAAAAVFLLMLGGISWLAWSNRRMADQLARLRQEQAATLQEQRALEQQIETLKAGLQLRETTNSQMAQLMQDTVPFNLDPSASRGPGQSTTLVIPSRAVYILFHIILQDNSHPRYDLSIRTVEDSLIWKQNDVERVVTRDHNQQLAVAVPSHLLEDGDYVLRVSAGGEDILHTVAGYSFHVTHHAQ